MATNSSMLHVRIDDDLRDRAQTALGAMGLTVADAVRLLFHRIATDQAFPIELKVPNAVTREAIVESEAIIAARRARFASGEELIEDLDNG